MPFPIALLDPPAFPSIPAPTLTDEQRLNLAALEKHFGAEDYVLPGDGTPLTEREMMFLSREMFLRFLGATKGDLPATTERLEKCLAWRREEKVDDVELMATKCSPESVTGKNIVMGYTPKGMPIMYFFPSRNFIPLEQRRAVHAVFLLERAVDLMCDGVENVLVIFNFHGKRQGPPTSISVARETIHILAQYYPGRLGVQIFEDMPWIVRTFVSMMWPFVDPVTREKVKFISGAQVVKDGHVEKDLLLKECGGGLDLPYDHEAYWDPMVKTCLERRAEQLKLWRELSGPKVGREERLFKRRPTTTPSEKATPVVTTTASTTATATPAEPDEAMAKLNLGTTATEPETAKDKATPTDLPPLTTESVIERAASVLPSAPAAATSPVT